MDGVHAAHTVTTVPAFLLIPSSVSPYIAFTNLALSVTKSFQVGLSFPLVLLGFIKKKKVSMCVEEERHSSNAAKINRILVFL